MRWGGAGSAVGIDSHAGVAGGYARVRVNFIHACEDLIPKRRGDGKCLGDQVWKICSRDSLVPAEYCD